MLLLHRAAPPPLPRRHAEQPFCPYGIDGLSGEIADMQALGVWEPYQVKAQTLKTAVESAQMLLRIDDIVSGMSKREKGSGPSKPSGAEVEDHDNVDSERMLAE